MRLRSNGEGKRRESRNGIADESIAVNVGRIFWNALPVGGNSHTDCPVVYKLRKRVPLAKWEPSIVSARARSGWPPPHTPPNGVASSSSFRPHTAHTNSAALTAHFSSFGIRYVSGCGIYSGVGVLLRILLMGFKLGHQIDRRALAYLLAYREYFVGTISRLWCWLTSANSDRVRSAAATARASSTTSPWSSAVSEWYSLDLFTFPTPDCANDAPFASMWCHCDGREYAHQPLRGRGEQCWVYALWQS